MIFPILRRRTWCGFALLFVPRLALAETYYGPELADLARQTVDVMRLHQHVMAQQLALDETPAYLELTLRSTPATFQFDDGAKMRAGISRVGLSMGAGFGNPTTGFAGFVGLQVDSVASTQFPNPFAGTTEGEGFDYGQGLLHAGLSAEGFQVTYGLMMSGDQASGLSPQGYFTRQGRSYRDGTPEDVRPTSELSYSHFITFTQAEGVSFGATLAEVASHASAAARDPRGTVLAALRAEFAPARLMERLELRERLGIPGIGLDRYAAEIDYWGDRYHEVKRQAEEIANGTRLGDGSDPAEAPAAPNARSETWELPLFLDDIAGTGLRVRIVPQLRPTLKLRAFEGSYRYQTDRLKVGARCFAFQRGKRITGSAEGYLAFQPEFFKYMSLFGVPWMTVSYSYNTPDSATFLPIPNAHVAGVQWIYGRPEMGRPLVPLLAQHQRDEGEE